MRLAPHPQWNATLARMPNGRAGVFHTLRLMRQLVNEARTDPAIIQTAVSAAFLVPEKDEGNEARSIFEFVRDHVRYVRDVLGVETLADPRMTLRRMVGDCDDQVTLLAALLESVGYPTRFVVAGYSQPGVFDHVYLQTLVNGEWVDADPTEPQPFGWAPPFPVVIEIERV